MRMIVKWNGKQRCLNLPQRFNARFGVDFVLGEDDRLRTEALDHAPHIRADCRRGEQDGYFAHRGKLVIAAPDCADKFLKAGRGHGQLFILAIAHERPREGVFPIRREGDERHNARGVGVGITKLAGQTRADMFRDMGDVFGVACGLGNPLQNGGQVADRNPARRADVVKCAGGRPR